MGRLNKRQYIRNWVKVSADELKGVNVCQLTDVLGDYFVSDTSWYIPEWLREEPLSVTSSIRALPADEKLVYTVKNNPDLS